MEHTGDDANGYGRRYDAVQIGLGERVQGAVPLPHQFRFHEVSAPAVDFENPRIQLHAWTERRTFSLESRRLYCWWGTDRCQSVGNLTQVRGLHIQRHHLATQKKQTNTWNQKAPDERFEDTREPKYLTSSTPEEKGHKIRALYPRGVRVHSGQLALVKVDEMHRILLQVNHGPVFHQTHALQTGKNRGKKMYFPKKENFFSKKGIFSQKRNFFLKMDFFF